MVIVFFVFQVCSPGRVEFIVSHAATVFLYQGLPSFVVEAKSRECLASPLLLHPLFLSVWAVPTNTFS